MPSENSGMLNSQIGKIKLDHGILDPLFFKVMEIDENEDLSFLRVLFSPLIIEPIAHLFFMISPSYYFI